MTLLPQPAIFVSHGAPNMVLHKDATTAFLADLPASLPQQPRAILMISAHWETPLPMVSATPRNTTIHDFGGFEPELYAMRYEPLGEPALAAQVAKLLADDGATIHPSRGLDHGAWVPLSLMWPKADIPILQLSVPHQAGPAQLMAIGKKLAPLRADNVLIIASGGFTHDLRSAFGYMRGGAPLPNAPDWVEGFRAWLETNLLSQNDDAMRQFWQLAPFARKNHPSDEHILPLFIAYGARTNSVQVIHRAMTLGVLALDAYRFD